MDHVKAIAIKFIATLALLYIILGLFAGMSFGNVLLITIVLGVIAYIIGDLAILSRTNNSIATVADFGLAFLVIWLMSDTLTVGDNLFTTSLLAALAVAVFEYFFHKYMAMNVFPDAADDNKQTGRLEYQTEASEELTPPETNGEKQ